MCNWLSCLCKTQMHGWLAKTMHASDHLYEIWKESIKNCRCYRADTIFKAKAKWPWRYRSRSKVIICNTPSHSSDHLCYIWKESIEKCRFFFQGQGRKISKICPKFKFPDSDTRGIIIKEQGKSEGFDSCDRPSNLTQIGFKSSIFQAVWPWNLMDDPKKTNRAPLLCNFKLLWIQTGVTVQKRLSWVLTSVTLTLTFCMDITFVINNNSWKMSFISTSYSIFLKNKSFSKSVAIKPYQK